jgi:DNA-binding response OmpR family regulator
MNTLLKILIIEDNSGDVDLVREMLNRTSPGSFSIESVKRLSEGLSRLKKGGIDVVLLDLGLPDSSGLNSFREICKENPEIPILVMTGLADETIGMQAVQEGAQDYLIKGTVEGKLLGRIIRFAIERRRLLDERDTYIAQLKEAMGNIRTLSSLLPICASCKKIRDDKGFWKQVEAYISEHTDIVFSHGICRDCEKKAHEAIEAFKNEAQ